jgi:hypothetical protein
MLGSSMIAATIPVTDLERGVKSIDYAEDRCRPQDTSHKSVRLEAHGYPIRMATSLDSPGVAVVSRRTAAGPR